MKKKIFPLTIAALLLLSGLVSCGDTSAEYFNESEGSVYGTVSDFSAESDKVKAGDTLTFKVEPTKNFTIGQVTNNNVACSFVGEDSAGKAIYSTKIVAGRNKILATFNVIPTVDIVSDFKMDVSDEVFAEIMTPSGTGSKSNLDFRRCGVEKVLAPLQYNASHQKVANSNKAFFINYVDGDTTHMVTNSLNYTVKMRYLGINTPESTSEIEEWGLTASYFNKFIYSGDEEIFTKYLASSTPKKPQYYGITSAILMSPAFAGNSHDATIDELNIIGEHAGEPTIYEADVDGYNRNLCYIWYSTVENPTKNDFRCLNLEMAAQGLSIGSSESSEMSRDYYLAFSTANLLAEANKLHRFSGLDDKNYDYYKRHEVQTVTLEQIYARGTTTDQSIKYSPDGNPLVDKKTLYKVHGYVSRMSGAAFYIQDKPSYTADYLANHDPYGIYIFTLRQSAIEIGDEVEVVGALSSYSGCYQMQGVSYHDIDPDYNRDIKIISSGNEIVPIEVTGKQLLEKCYPNVLVKVTDPCYGCNWDKVSYSVNYGGSHERDTSNETYAFYNTDNEMNLYMGYGDRDETESLNKSSLSLSSNKLMRVRIDAKVLLGQGTETAYSTKYFGGGTTLYNFNGAEYANKDDDNPYLADTIEETYTRKKVTKLVGVSCAYNSASGKTKRMQVVVLSQRDIATESIG